MTVSIICETHAILGQDVCQGNGKLRTRPVRLGQCRFCQHLEVPSAMDRYVQALEKVIAREDLTPHAKSAWAGMHLLSIHPFIDGNGRLSRLLINWVLKQCGLDFPIVLCSSDEQRTAWANALAHGLRSSPDRPQSQPLALVIAIELAKCWTETEREYERAAKDREEATEDRILRKARTRAQEGSCAICLDGSPNMMVLCCGAAYHHACLSRWLQTAPNAVCPTCRSVIPAPQVQQVSGTRAEREPRVEWMALPFELLGHELLRPARAERQMERAGAVAEIPVAGARQHEAALCAFCPNQRAVNCSLHACARCCSANQMLYGIRCVRHTTPVEDFPEIEWRPSSTESLSLRSDSTFFMEYMTDSESEDGVAVESNRCTFCPNRRANTCVNLACRSCCLSRLEPCARHSPTNNAPRPRDIPTGLSVSAGSREQRRARWLQRDIVPMQQETPARLITRLNAAPLSGSRPPNQNLASAFQRPGQCLFCPNRGAQNCPFHACRTCCIINGGPCLIHRNTARASAPGNSSPQRSAPAHPPPVPRGWSRTVAGNDEATRGNISHSASSNDRPQHMIDEGMQAAADMTAAEPPLLQAMPNGQWRVLTVPVPPDMPSGVVPPSGLPRGLPLSPPPRLDPDDVRELRTSTSRTRGVDSSAPGRCRFCSNHRAVDCISNACGRCCMARMLPCPRHSAPDIFRLNMQS
jgi:hypothetical protein